MKLGWAAEQSGLEKEKLWSMIRPFAPVAQLDRVPDYESGGRTFESYRARHTREPHPLGGAFLYPLSSAEGTYPFD